MDHKTVEDYVLSMPNSKREYPFGEEVAVYKVLIPNKPGVSHAEGVQVAAEKSQRTVHKSTESEHRKPAPPQSPANDSSASISDRRQDIEVRGDWKMFALIAEGKDPVRLSLKCDPLLAETLRKKYETVLEGYHLNKKHWNTILLTGQLPGEEVQGLIRHSYDLVTKAGTDTPQINE